MSGTVMSDLPMKPAGGKIVGIAREELGGFSVRCWLASLLTRPIPAGLGGRLRAQVYRAFGFQIGPRTLLAGPLTLADPSRARAHLRVGARCFINSPVFLDLAAPITLGDGVSLGHHVLLITSDHAIGPPEFRAGTRQAAPITVGAGAWIAAGATLLPGVTVGAGAVVAAGAVVTKDVPPNTLVGGIPAKVIRTLG